MDRESTEAIIHAFVTTNLDYCNAILYGLPKVLLNRLQLVQNRAARIVTFTKKNEHITPILIDLNWLPVDYRITVEPRFNEPLFNEVLNITDDILCPGQSYSKMYGIETRYNEPRYNEFFDITNIIRMPKRKIYLDITNCNVNMRQRYPDNSPPGQFAPWTIRPRQLAPDIQTTSPSGSVNIHR